MAGPLTFPSVPFSAAGALTGFSRIACGSSSSRMIRSLLTNCAMSSGSMSIRSPTPSCFPLTKRARVKHGGAGGGCKHCLLAKTTTGLQEDHPRPTQTRRLDRFREDRRFTNLREIGTIAALDIARMTLVIWPASGRASTTIFLAVGCWSGRSGTRSTSCRRTAARRKKSIASWM